MISRLLEAVRPRVDQADAWTATDETLTVTVGTPADRFTESGRTSAQLRVVTDGRIGMAAGQEDNVDALVNGALASAQAAPAAVLHLPAPAPLPDIRTAWPEAAALDPTALADLARALHDRLSRDGWDAETWATRSLGRVEVGNSRGVQAGYEVTLVGTGCTVRGRAGSDAGSATARLHLASALPPDAESLDRLAKEVRRLLAPPVAPSGSRVGPTRVLLGPRAVIAFLVPFRQALHARALSDPMSPLSGRMDEQVVSSDLTLVDHPLVPARPGSRPVDDEGVVCRRQALIERGVLRGWLADLVTASAMNLPPSGQSWRVGAAGPRAGWSNVVLEAGETRSDDLLGESAGGLFVADLPAPVRHLGDGRVQLATPWACTVEGGEIRERLESVTLRCNVHDVLNRVVAVGDTLEWWGAAAAPPLLVDGMLAG